MHDPFKNHSDLVSQYIKSGLPQDQLTKLTQGFLEESWVKKLLIFSDHILCVADLKTLNYLYVSPSIENVTGFPSSDFSNIKDLQKIVPAKEVMTTTSVTGIALQELVRRKLNVSELKRIRFSRNTWCVRKDQIRINLLQHGFMLAFDETGMPLVEFIVISDITSYNNSPNHFYKLALMNDDGTEEILTQGIYENDVESISVREREVFTQMTLGNTSEKIAKQLNISVETVKTHRKNILTKTGTDNSMDLLRYGYSRGWI